MCRSLGLFTEHSLVRRFCMRAITNPYFEGFVLVLVLLSSVLLALDTPSLDDSSRLAQVISTCDIIFVACFLLEMCLKVRAASPLLEVVGSTLLEVVYLKVKAGSPLLEVVCLKVSAGLYLVEVMCLTVKAASPLLGVMCFKAKAALSGLQVVQSIPSMCLAYTMCPGTIKY